LRFDLQRIGAIAQSLSGGLAPEIIAQRVTSALVEDFDCVFARLWLLESDQKILRLVASAGLYTHIDGSFARVPMGAYKVGKIAQNRVPFLSNQLADEPWVKDRQWAIDNQIQGFAGYPLVANDRLIGVLASFSHQAMAPEFLDVLQVLCFTTAIALEAALRIHHTPASSFSLTGLDLPLSDRLAALFNTIQPMLVGTERPLTAALDYVFLQVAAALNQLDCHYCRLTYGPDDVTLEAIAAAASHDGPPDAAQIPTQLRELQFAASHLGGTLQLQSRPQQQVLQCLLSLPYPHCSTGPTVWIQCQVPLLQLALTQLAYRAGLRLGEAPETATVCLSDSPGGQSQPTIWLRWQTPRRPLAGANLSPVVAVIDLSIQPDQLRQLVERVAQGQPDDGYGQVYGQKLSEREQEVMTLLAQGLRDRDIAQRLYISESTVKFHINNSLSKLNAKNRYQGVYEAAVGGWI